MKAYVNKPQENKSNANAESSSQQQNIVNPVFQFTDNRPEATEQKELVNIVNNSPQSKQLGAFQEMANSSTPSQDIVQLRTIKRKEINGITHLVKLTEGHLYNNKNWLKNEREEVRSGDLLDIDVDKPRYSRRGINQETNWEHDRAGVFKHLWYEAVSLNENPLEKDEYVRAEMLVDPPAIILAPRKETDFDEAIRHLLDLVKGEKHEPLKQKLKALREKLHIEFNPDPIDLESIGTELSSILEESGLPDSINEHIANLLRVYNEYKKPKTGFRSATGGKISRAIMNELELQGIDLGGTGKVLDLINKSDVDINMLDVNINDSVNTTNYLVIGNAMNLSQSFKRDCTDRVIAKLLPVVDMETNHTVEARLQAIASVLHGVNYICPEGTASIKFNDNSGPARVSEEQLLKLGEQYGFKLEKQNIAERSLFNPLDFQNGFNGLRKVTTKKENEEGTNKEVEKPKVIKRFSVKPKDTSITPTEGRYRDFTFTK